MKIAGEGKLLRIFIGESDTLHGHSLYDVLVRKARELGLAGATVWRGIEGYGAASRILPRPMEGPPKHDARRLPLRKARPGDLEPIPHLGLARRQLRDRNELRRRLDLAAEKRKNDEGEKEREEKSDHRAGAETKSHSVV